MLDKDFYTILGVKRDATQKEIKKAARELTRQFHPDVNPGDAAAEARFKEITEAYDTLGDVDKRRTYNLTHDLSYDTHRQNSGATPNSNSSAFKEKFTAAAQQDLVSELHNAVIDQRVQTVERLLCSGVVATERTLNCAIKYGYGVDWVDAFIRNGTKPKDPALLQSAIGVKNKRIFQSLLRAGLIPQENNLRHAVRCDATDIAAIIIEHGIKPTQEMLNYSMESKETDMLDLLLSTGLKPSQGTLECVIKYKLTKLMDVFAKHRVQPTQEMFRDIFSQFFPSSDKSKREKMILSMLKSGIVLDSYNTRSAILTNNPDIIAACMSNGAKPTMAMFEMIYPHRIAAGKAMLHNGFQPDEKILLRAVKEQRYDWAKEILDSGTKPTAGMVAIAVRKDCHHIVTLLLAHGAQSKKITQVLMRMRGWPEAAQKTVKSTPACGRFKQATQPTP